MSHTPQVIIKLHANPDAPEAIEFFRRLGISVSLWAFVDRSLYQIFHHNTGFEQKQSALVFYGLRAFGQRLRLVDRSAKTFLPREVYDDELVPLLTEAKTLAATRNILAHHPTLRIGTAINGEARDVYMIRIEPYERVLNDDYPGLLGKDALEVADLISHADAVEELRSKLDNFAWRAGGLRAAAKGHP
jgi:hypothetical protein